MTPREAIQKAREAANERDTARACVKVANAALRRAQARRIKRQPGLTDEQRAVELARLRIKP